MALKCIDDSIFTAIAAAIRAKLGGSAKYKPGDMAAAIASIPTGSSDVPFDFGGMNAVKIAEFSDSWKLADTSFVKGSSASTSATSILASTSNKYVTASTNIGDKDVVVIQRLKAVPTGTYTSGARQVNFTSTMVTWMSKGRASEASASETTRRNDSCTYNHLRYYNTSNSATFANTNYGLYGTPATPNVASTSAASTTVRIGSPTLYYRASSSYFSTDNLKKVTDCTWTWTAEVYLVDSKTTPGGAVMRDAINRSYS